MSPAEKLMLEYCKSHNCGCFDHRITDLQRIIEKLMLKLFDTEDLLKEVIKLLFVHELVAQLGDRQSLPWPPLVYLVFFQAGDGTRDKAQEPSGVQTCACPISNLPHEFRVQFRISGD